MLKTPEALLRRWMSMVNKGDGPGLMALYAEQAVLIPTFSNRLLSTPASISEYFERLCTREQLSISLHRKTLRVQPLREQLYALSGIYRWSFAVDEELLNFEARFSYLLDLDLASPILQHHSSQIPRTL